MSSSGLKLRDPASCWPRPRTPARPRVRWQTLRRRLPPLLRRPPPLLASRPHPQLPPAPPAAKAALRPQSPKAPAEPDAHAGAPSERRDAEPVPKKRRLLEASEAADAQEPPAPARPLSDPQDILAKACFAVGIDSDLAESVVEEPLPPPQGSHLPPQPHAEAVHYVQGLRPPYPGVPADVRLRPPEVRLHPAMPHPAAANGAFPVADARLQYHPFAPRFPEPPFALPRRLPAHADPRHCHPGPQPRYQYVAYPRGVPPPRAILVSERAPPPHHAAMHHDPRRPAPRPCSPTPGGRSRPCPTPRATRRRPRRSTTPGSLRRSTATRRGRPPRRGTWRPGSRSHHEVAMVAPVGPAPFAPADGSRPGPPRPKLDRQPHGEPRPHPYEMYTPPPGSAHSPKEAYAPVSPHALPGNPHYGPPRVVDRYNKHPYGREGAWAAKRYPDAQDKAGEFIPPQRLREPKPCVELIPLRLPPSQEKEKRPGGEGHPVPSSPGPPQKTQVTAPISPATVTPVNRKASEKGAPAEKYARINTPDDGEIQEVSQGNGRLQLPSGLTVTETAASPPVRHNAAAKRENRDAFAHPEKSDESAKRSHSGSDSAGVPQAHADLRKKSEASTEGNSRPPEPQENCRENTPNSAGALELTASHHEPLELKHDRVSASKRQAENGDPHPATEEGHHRGLPSALEQYYSLHSSYYVSQGRSASEPPPGAAGPSANLLPGMRPASLPAATQISVSSAPPARDAAPPAGPKMNGRAKGAPEGNHDDDEAFVERLRFVLDDLVSVPEATLPKASRSPQQVLAYLVRQGGAKPSEHPCLRERLREDFVTMVKRYMPGSTIADWGWDACTPEQILDQLIKVSTGGDDGLNGGERSARTASAAQDDPLEDDVFTSSSDGPQGPRTAPVSHAHPRPSLPTPPAHRASPPGTSSSQPSAPPSTSTPAVPTPPSTSSFPHPRRPRRAQHSSQPSAPSTATAGARKPQEEVLHGARSPAPPTTVPPSPTPVTSPLAASTPHAYSAGAGYQHTPPTQTSPHAPASHAAFPLTTTAHSKTPHVSPSHTMAQQTYSVHATVAHVPTSSPATVYTSNADPTAQHGSTTLTNATHVHSNDTRVAHVTTGCTTPSHVTSAHANAPAAYPNHTTAAQALTTYTTMPYSMPTTTQTSHSPAVYSAAQHLHHLQRSAPSTVTPDAYPDEKLRHSAPRSVVPQPATSVPYSAPPAPSVPQSSVVSVSLRPHSSPPVPYSVHSVPHSAASAPHFAPSGPHSAPSVPHSARQPLTRCPSHRPVPSVPHPAPPAPTPLDPPPRPPAPTRSPRPTRTSRPATASPPTAPTLR
ncbi:hypothetical protein C7M84_004238 [Penaeus vannamei]|uniref:Uncharacterized protein n=1 Tax=Penaeus vannamei TaxID=6689 RepID=A0A423TKZ2_PENVA|nr:hypothetical protein C7M84_004238 [Penaeus vannamei]